MTMILTFVMSSSSVYLSYEVVYPLASNDALLYLQGLDLSNVQI